MSKRGDVRRGVVCPDCGDARSRVAASRRHRDGKNVRTRICQNPKCGRRYITTERVTG